jgi:hypothetical protein
MHTEPVTDEVGSDESGAAGDEEPHLARIVATATGLLFGIGVGLLVADGRWWPLVVLPFFAVGLSRVFRALVPAEDRPRAGRLVALASALRVAVAVLLYTGSLAAGWGGFIPGDDAGYAQFARVFVAWLKGELDPALGRPWADEADVFNTWVYLESAIFFVIGPEVLVPILLNGVFAMVASLLVFDVVRRLFDRRAALLALALTAFYPSLVLWTSLNLKDALSLLLIMVCLWSLVRFQDRALWVPLIVAFAAALLLQSMRHYLFVGLVLLIPIAVAVAPRLAREMRVRWAGGAALVSAILLIISGLVAGVDPRLLETSERVRQGMTVGARTAYVQPPPLVVYEGDTFVVASPEPTGVPSAGPTVSPPAGDVIHVLPNTRIEIASGGPRASPAPGTVLVRPGDLVVVGTAARTAAPIEARKVLRLPPGSSSAVLVDGSSGAAVLIREALRDLPSGALFALLGPFPWLFERQLDLLVLSEMIVWYACLVGFAATLARERRRWAALAPLALFLIGMLALFSIVEGNWGTLFRHRAMVVPTLIAIASPSLVRIARTRTADPVFQQQGVVG